MADEQANAVDLAQATRAMLTDRRAPLTAENYNRAMLAIVRGQDSMDFDSALEDMANGRQRSPSPAAQRGVLRGEQTATRAAGGTADRSTVPAAAPVGTTPPAAVPAVPPATPAAVQPTVAPQSSTGPVLDLLGEGNAAPSQPPAADPTGDFAQAGVNNPLPEVTPPTPPVADQPQPDARLPLRQLSQSLHNGTPDPGTAAMLAMVLGIGGGGNPFTAPVKPRISVRAGSQPSGTVAPTPAPAPVAPPPMARMPTNSVTTVGPRGPQTNVEYPATPRPVQIRMPDGGRTPGPVQAQSNPIQYTPGRPVAPDIPVHSADETAALTRLLANQRAPSPGSTPGSVPRPMGEMPAPVAAPPPAVGPREVPISQAAPPPRSGPSPANVARQAERQAERVKDAERTGAEARSRIHVRNANRRGYGARRADD